MGLFDLFLKKQDSKYELPAKLEALLNMVLQKGSVSEKDLVVLREEAKNHGISPGELDIIIESRLPKKEDLLDSNEVESVIASNSYAKEDSIEIIFQKYDSLSECSEKSMSHADREKLYRAQRSFVTSIIAPKDKETMLDFISRAIPNTKYSMPVAVVVANIKSFFSSIKSEIQSGKSQPIENDAQIQAKYKSLLAEVWEAKLERLFKTAETKFGNEEQFIDELQILDRQFRGAKSVDDSYDGDYDYDSDGGDD